MIKKNKFDLIVLAAKRSKDLSKKTNGGKKIIIIALSELAKHYSINLLNK